MSFGSELGNRITPTSFQFNYRKDIMKIVSIKSPSEFVLEIEMFVKEAKCDYMDAVMLYCEKHNIEVETAAELIKQNSVLKAKVQYEAEILNMVKRSTKLSI